MDEAAYWQAQDILRCADDFYYWLAHYGWMKDEEGEVTGPGVVVWPEQREYLERYRRGEWLICGKARRVGLSWLATLADLHDMLFSEHVRIAVIAQDDDWAMFHLDRLRWVFEQQPPHIARVKPVVGKDNKHVLGLSNGSVFAAYPCTGKQARGAGGKRIRLEEFALYQDAESVYTAAYGAVKDRGQLVIISTGQGEGGDFHKRWQDAGAGKNELAQVFLGWRARPDRPDNFRDGMDALQRQEFPETPEEMFLSTGVKFFDSALLQILAERNLRDPMRIEEGGQLRIWADPVRGRQYVIGADVADGGGDSCAACVDDAETGETVAVYHSGIIDSNGYGDVLYALGKRYGWAYTGVERNNMGADTVGRMINLAYPNLYYHQHYDPSAATERPRAGWLTDTASRPTMLGGLKTVLNDPCRAAFHDAEIFAQFRAFGWYNNRWDHPKGGHDDLIFAKGIAQQMRQVLATMTQPDIVVYQGDRRIA
jgi:hypothetical protein